MQTNDSTDTAAPKPRPIHHYTSLRIYCGGDGGGDPPLSAILYDDVDVLDTILRINKTWNNEPRMKQHKKVMQSIQQSTMAAIKHYNNICYIREEVVRYVWLSCWEVLSRS